VTRRELAAQDRRVHRGLAVTAPPLTVLDAAVELGDDGAAFLDDALRRSVPFAAVHAANARYPGSAAAPRLLRGAAERSAHEARRALHALLRGAGVGGWSDAVHVDGHPVDAAFPGARVAVLASGWAEPEDLRHTEATAQRWTALIAQGWTIVHVTWRDLVERPHAALADICRVVARSRSGGPDEPRPPRPTSARRAADDVRHLRASHAREDRMRPGARVHYLRAPSSGGDFAHPGPRRSGRRGRSVAVSVQRCGVPSLPPGMSGPPGGLP
jgi:hypothetical protein